MSSARGGSSTAAAADVATAAPAAPEMSSLARFRRTVFPIYGREEAKKFFLVGSIKFFVIMALTLTRDLKDTMLVTQCGAEAISFLKIYGVLPAATGFIALYSKMASVLDKKTLFYTTCIPFFVFFLLFDRIIYPNASSIQPTLELAQSALGIDAAATGFLSVLARIASNWTSALYYIIAELYSSVSVGVLFWQFANDVVEVDQAKRFYPLFAQMSGLAPILAGQYAVRYASRAADFRTSLTRLTAATTFAGVMMCLFYSLSVAYMERQQRAKEEAEATSGGRGGDEKEAEPVPVPAPKKKGKKPKMSMTESARFLASSQYMRLIAILVLSYGLTVNMTDVLWKSILKKRYPDPLDYQRFMGNFSSVVGLSTCIVIFFGVHVIRLLGWRVGALVTPVTMATLGLPFFACVLMGLDGPGRLGLAVAVGTVQTLLSKTAKYALFDPTTQMAYIPLDEESKVKGKAAIDVLGSRLGKSGGSLLQQFLVLAFGDMLSAAPAVAVLFYTLLFGWMNSARRLGGLFEARTEMAKAEGQENKEQQQEEKRKKEL
uniref:ADP,ATP carrier protein n=1 Tax=Odontella aurita TaxID=265563 RepID=A0A7S4JV62_9STRA